MTKSTVALGALAIMLVGLLGLVGHRVLNQALKSDQEPSEVTSQTTKSEPHQGVIFGRITTNDGAIYEGRLRFGGDEEAFWGDYFDGSKVKNPWLIHVPPEELLERRPVEIFGVEVFQRERQVNLARPFMARLGDIARIEADGRDLRVTLKSGTVFHLDRYEADDFADGMRVWDGRRGVLDFDENQIRSIEFLSDARAGTVSDRLYGAVRTRGGDFTGFIQWDRTKGDGSDEIGGHTADGALTLRFDTVRSIARKSTNSSLVTLLDGKEVVLSEDREVGPVKLYVDDHRYGRVLISWDTFERVDFTSGGGGPAYTEFPAGRPLTGGVTTHDGRRLTGRLVYDLDESETTETLDAPSQGVDYTIPFGLIASIELPGERASVTLHSGEVLQLELAGDLGKGNGGMLIFVEGRTQPQYVRWAEIKEIHFERPAAMYPPIERRSQIRVIRG
jgi:hypothetical protein